MNISIYDAPNSSYPSQLNYRLIFLMYTYWIFLLRHNFFHSQFVHRRSLIQMPIFIRTIFNLIIFYNHTKNIFSFNNHHLFSALYDSQKSENNLLEILCFSLVYGVTSSAFWHEQLLFIDYICILKERSHSCQYGSGCVSVASMLMR